MAAIPHAPGATDYSSTARTSFFIPEVYSGKLVTKMYATTCFGEICSTDYQGEISGYGDNIIIRTVPDITVSDYTLGSNFTAADYQAPTSAHVELPINKAKKFLVKINTVDAHQSDIDMVETFTDEASMKIKIAMDTDLLANIPTDVDAANQGATAGAISGDVSLGTTTTPISITTSNAVDFLLDLGQVMDEQNISDEDRWVILPSWYVRKLKASVIKDAHLTGDEISPLRNGKVGMIDRFTVYQSNHLTITTSPTTSTPIIAGHKSGLAWASQITELEQNPNPWDFGSLIRGLCVYGYKVINGKFLALGRVAKGNG